MQRKDLSFDVFETESDGITIKKDAQGKPIRVLNSVRSGPVVLDAFEINNLSNGVINTTIIDIIKYNDVKIGSSNIIKLLNEGKIEEANNLLGYNYSFTGTVIKGKQIGRTIGFPTANIDNQNVKKILKTP